MWTKLDADDFDIRATPIWAIPQIAFVRNTTRGTITYASFSDTIGAAMVRIRIPDEGEYEFIIRKENMNNLFMPPLAYYG